MEKLSWRDLANALEKHKPDVAKRFSLAELTYITRDLNALADAGGEPKNFVRLFDEVFLLNVKWGDISDREEGALKAAIRSFCEWLDNSPALVLKAVRCNRCQADLCEHDNCTDWTCARACSKCAAAPSEGEKRWELGSIEQWDMTCANGHRPVQLRQQDGLDCPLCSAASPVSPLSEEQVEKVLRETRYNEGHGTCKDVANALNARLEGKHE